MRRLLIAGACLGVVCWGVSRGAARAADAPPPAASEVEKLRKEIEEEKRKREEQDRKIEEMLKALDRKQAEAPAAPAAGTKLPDWINRVTLFGDLRLRFEDIDKHEWDPEVRNRERLRIRARLGMDVKANDEVDLRFRIATDEGKDITKGGDPNSNDQTMTNGETKKPIWLDIARFDYHPAVVPGLDVIGGKMEVPFFKPGGSYNELIWNNSLTPEGGAIKYCPKFGNFEVISAVGGFMTMERETSFDSSLLGAQGGLKLTLAKDMNAYVLAGAGYFNYINTEGQTVFDYAAAPSNGFGNTKNGTLYQFGYQEAEFFAEAGVTLDIAEHKVPLMVFGDFVQNQASDLRRDDQGWMVGGSIGRLKNPGDLAVSYNYRELEKDAVLGAFTDSSSCGGGTNGKGHKFSMEAQVMKNVSLAATYFLDKVNISETDTSNKEAGYRRFQFDINFKF